MSLVTLFDEMGGVFAHLEARAVELRRLEAAMADPVAQPAGCAAAGGPAGRAGGPAASRAPGAAGGRHRRPGSATAELSGALEGASQAGDVDEVRRLGEEYAGAEAELEAVLAEGVELGEADHGPLRAVR